MLPVPLAGAAANSSLNLSAASLKLVESVDRNASKFLEIRNMSLEHKILPEAGRTTGGKGKTEYIMHPLISCINAAYTSSTRGNSHVIYAPASTGKTTACRAIVELVAPKRRFQALMITGARKDRPYLTYMKSVLNVAKEEDTLMVLVDGMRTVEPTPASLLILDEMNDFGVDNCNIELVDALMRYIYEQKQRIHLMVVTQTKGVADALCKLNNWQKIGPLDGLTIPTRKQVRNREKEPLDSGTEIVWDSDILKWSVESLTRLIDNLNKDKGLVKEGDTYPWLRYGMTPTEAEQACEEEIENMLLLKAQEAAKTSGDPILDVFEGIDMPSKPSRPSGDA